MLELSVIVEGETEAAFIKQVIAPELRLGHVFVKPVFPRDKQGGAVTIDRLKTGLSSCLKVVTSLWSVRLLTCMRLIRIFPAMRMH